MEDRRRTRSQGLPEGEQLIKWDSLQDPVRIEREQAEARRQARGASVVIDTNRRMIENSEILQVTEGQPRAINKNPQQGEISPNHQSQEGHMNTTPKSGEISPARSGEHSPQYVIEDMSEGLQKGPNEVTDLLAMEEGVKARTPNKTTQRNSKSGNWTAGRRKFIKRIASDRYSTTLFRRQFL